MENVFIVRYRRALRELEEAYKLQYALVDESDALRTLAYQQAHTAEKAILKNRKSGRGFLISRLRECLDEQPYAWAITQHIKGEIEEMEASRYDSEVSNEQNHALYLVIEDAICELLEVFGSQFPKMLTGAAIATCQGNVPVSELVLKFGPTHLQRIVRQRLKAAADIPASAAAIIEAPQPSSPPLDTPAASATTEPLDTPAAPPLTEHLPIDDVLVINRTTLDRILLDVAMIEPDTTTGRYKAKPTVKPWQWANVRAALQTKLLLAEINDYDAARLFTETYRAIVSRATMRQRPEDEQNSKLKKRRTSAYAEFRDRLPAPNPS